MGTLTVRSREDFDEESPGATHCHGDPHMAFALPGLGGSRGGGSLGGDPVRKDRFAVRQRSDFGEEVPPGFCAG